MSHYIADNNTVLNLQSIYWVIKKDRCYNQRYEFYLEVEYKSRKLEIQYKTEEERNEMFQKAVSAIIGKEQKKRDDFEKSLEE